MLVAVNLVYIAVDAFALTSSRVVYKERAQQSARNISLGLESAINAKFEGIDLSLRSLNRDPWLLTIFLNGTTEQIRALLLAQNARQNYSEGFKFFNETGKLIAASTATDTEILLGESELFQRLKQQRVDALGVTTILISNDSRKSTIVLARRLVDQNSNFRGIVAAEIRLSYFTSLLAGLELGASGVASIRDDHRALVSRVPPIQDSSSSGFRVFGSMRTVSADRDPKPDPLTPTFDDTDKYVSYVQLKQYLSAPVEF